MTVPRWLDERALLLLHDESIAEHGGASGLREPGMLSAAMARPLNRIAYEPHYDLARLAASYATGIVRNRPFVDGNKRTAFLAAGLFLLINGQRLTVDKAEATLAVLRLAGGEIEELAFTDWIRTHLRPR